MMPRVYRDETSVDFCMHKAKPTPR